MDAADISVLITLGFIVLALLVAQVLYLNTLFKLLNKIEPENREMEPGMVFLMLIPIWSIVWRFILVNRVTRAVGIEFRARGIEHEDQNPGKQVGIWYAALYTIAGLIPIAGLAGRVLWIIFWIKMKEFSETLGPEEKKMDVLDEGRYLK